MRKKNDCFRKMEKKRKNERQRRWRLKVKNTEEYKKKERERKRKYRKCTKANSKIPKTIITSIKRRKKRATAKLVNNLKNLREKLAVSASAEFKQCLIDDIAQSERMLRIENKRRIPNSKTIFTYWRRVELLHERITGKEKMVDLKWLENYAKVRKFIDESKFSEGTKNTQVNSIASILKHLDLYCNIYKKYSQWNSELSQNQKKQIAQNTLSANKHYIPSWRAIMEKIYDKTWQQFLYNFRSEKKYAMPGPRKILFFDAIRYMYTMYPPRRIEDYQYLKLADKASKTFDDRFNYVVFDDKAAYFVFFKYKTSKIYGKPQKNLNGGKKFFLPHTLNVVLRQYILTNNIKKGNFLFGQTANSFYANFSKKVMEAFNGFGRSGEALSCNDLRHAYISFLYYNNTPLTLRDKKKIANLMAHSVSMQEQYAKIELSVK